MARKILVTGATGFLGRHTRPILERRYGKKNVVGVNSADYDLMDPGAVKRMFDDVKPEVVVHYAAYCGGIGANRKYPAKFYYNNTLLTALVFDAASRHDVKKLVYPMGGCSYPAEAKSPIGEEQLWNGYPQTDSAGYATAKMMGLVAARCYRDQHGLNTTIIIPGNMYGEYDNFHPLDSHVIPAMIRRYHEAKLNGVNRVEMWGTGAPQRDFVYAGDVARTIPFFIDSYDEVGPVNVSTGSTASIKELAEIIAELVGYAGEIFWDTSKPDGQMVKIYSVERMRSLGLSCETPIKEGLKRTIDWFSANYACRGDGLRL